MSRLTAETNRCRGRFDRGYRKARPIDQAGANHERVVLEGLGVSRSPPLVAAGREAAR
jgi:hypothetical protein